MEFFFPIKKILSDFLNECDFFLKIQKHETVLKNKLLSFCF